MKKYILLIVATILPMICSAQLYAMRDSVQNGYDFWLYLPDKYKDLRAERMEKADSTHVDDPLPVVVFLHGRSLSGTNLNTVRKYGSIDAVKRGRKINAVIIAPQVDFNDWWRPERVMNVVEWVAKRYDVDLTRLYVLGMSLGGYGTLDFAATYPDRTAAAIALCGGSTLRGAALAPLNKVPTWIMHGTADASVAVSESRRVKTTMEEHDANTPRLRYDEWKGAGHSIYARVFYMPEAYEWLFKHSTTDVNRPVDQSVQIPTSRFSNVYSGLPRGGIALTVFDPPTKSSNKGCYMDNSIETPAPQYTNDEPDSPNVTKISNGNSSSKSTANSTATISYKYHTIADGDTLGHIAIKYGTTVKRLCELNGINKSAILGIGKRLKVAVVHTEPEIVYHTITAEDTSYGAIAKRYNTTIEAIMQLNGLTEPKVYHVGEKIIVAKRSSTSNTKSTHSNKVGSTATYHIIEDGDTLGHIAIKYGTTVKRLCELNGIDKGAILSIGKKLRVK